MANTKLSFTEFCEKAIGTPLMPWQKEFLKTLEKSKGRVIVNGRRRTIFLASRKSMKQKTR